MVSTSRMIAALASNPNFLTGRGKPRHRWGMSGPAVRCGNAVRARPKSVFPNTQRHILIHAQVLATDYDTPQIGEYVTWHHAYRMVGSLPDRNAALQ